jgi:glyoxylase I family protein
MVIRYSTTSKHPALQSPHMVTGIEHVAIASPDPLRLALWYVEHLDFVINYQSAHSQTVFIKAADGSMIEIIESAPDTVPAAGMNPAGLRHLALTVADFPGTYARLKEKGARFLTDAQTTNGNSLAFFTDPDGNILHLLHRETPCRSPHSAAIAPQTERKSVAV